MRVVGGEGSYRGRVVFKRVHKHVGPMNKQADGGTQVISVHGPDSFINQILSVLLMTGELVPHSLAVTHR